MNRGEVWWVDFEPAVGSEIRKTRPAIIISNDAANWHLARVTVIPVTSNVSRVYPSEAIVIIGKKCSKAMANQITTVDKSRLKSQVGILSKTDMRAVEGIVNVHLALSL